MAGDSEPFEEKPEASFEKELESLERAVTVLERGDLSLDEAIRQYEAGHQSLKRCYKILEGAQKRIEILSNPSLGVSEGMRDSPPARSEGKGGPGGTAVKRPADEGSEQGTQVDGAVWRLVESGTESPGGEDRAVE